ncbi:HAD-IA family hydrolase [Candidatus Saccharibacteria bacterium]|jgi:FMN phosphatase YigB (HAD superfamily)/DNA-binding transcriptional regulator YiaG|nr:HAD-IA family hydrolase [Candidatus Saccharibacteria bacterium]
MNDGEGTAKKELALGKAIAKARKKAGLTQQDLCFKAGLSYSTLAKIERGAIKTPSVFTVSAIAEATGQSIDHLLGKETATASNTPQKAYKTSKSGIKFVYFDVNGVLVRYYQRAFTSIAYDFNVSPERVEDIFWQYEDKLVRGQMSMAEFNSILVTNIGSQGVDWKRYYLDNIEPNESMKQVVEWAAENYKIGLLTNNFPEMTRSMLANKILPDVNYWSVVDSSEVKTAKPEEAIFQKATQMAGVEPNEILLIDDERPNVIAAQRMGWRVMWFDDYNQEANEAKIKQMLEF